MKKGASYRLGFIDPLRGVAILLVFLYHALGAVYGGGQLGFVGNVKDFDAPIGRLLLYPLSYGWSGVPIFFVISGFCIQLSFSRNRDWMGFFTRRVFRIFPPYIAAVALFLILTPLGGAYLKDGVAWQAVTHVFAVHNFWPGTFGGVNPSFWSIAVEFQLYLAFPLLVALVSARGWGAAVRWTLGIEVALRTLESVGDVTGYPVAPFALIESPFAFWFSWSLGAYLADCFLNGKRSGLEKVGFALALTLALVVPLHKASNPFAFPAFALATAVAMDRILYGAWSAPSGKFFSAVSRHLSRLGLVSYSFYLLHQPIMTEWTVAALRTWPDIGRGFALWVVAVTSYLPILLLSVGWRRYLERPGIAVGRRLATGSKAVIADRKPRATHVRISGPVRDPESVKGSG